MEGHIHFSPLGGQPTFARRHHEKRFLDRSWFLDRSSRPSGGATSYALEWASPLI